MKAEINFETLIGAEYCDFIINRRSPILDISKPTVTINWSLEINSRSWGLEIVKKTIESIRIDWGTGEVTTMTNRNCDIKITSADRGEDSVKVFAPTEIRLKFFDRSKASVLIIF